MSYYWSKTLSVPSVTLLYKVACYVTVSQADPSILPSSKHSLNFSLLNHLCGMVHKVVGFGIFKLKNNTSKIFNCKCLWSNEEEVAKPEKWLILKPVAYHGGNSVLQCDDFQMVFHERDKGKEGREDCLSKKLGRYSFQQSLFKAVTPCISVYKCITNSMCSM